MPTSIVPSRNSRCLTVQKVRFTVLLLILAVIFCTWASASTQPPTRIIRACRAA
jgi:hypothetical protein